MAMFELVKQFYVTFWGEGRGLGANTPCANVKMRLIAWQPFYTSIFMT